MTVSKNDKGLWDVQFYYKDYRGKNTKKHKRNFRTKKEAVEWANKYINQQSHNLDMDFSSFWQLYREDMKERLRENTVRTKDYIMELKVLPYFGDKKIVQITAADIRRWQNSLMKEGYSPTYLKIINNQLSALFNYAVSPVILAKRRVLWVKGERKKCSSGHRKNLKLLLMPLKTSLFLIALL